MVSMDKAKMVVVGAGVLAAIFWYITSQQRVQDDKVDADFARFDEQFDNAWAANAKGADAMVWKEDSEKAAKRLEKAEKRLEKSQKVDDEAFDNLEKELEKQTPQ